MLRSAWNWIDERTGLGKALGHFLSEEIPASSGWPQVFGSVALFLFLLQIFTGILLAMNYAPTPAEAYDSLRYILTAIPAGRLIHGLHHWGASFMIVLVALHMAQVFLYGAYKKPREVTWMLGVILLLLTLAFGLTGYLLPWDNRAYWGTVVTTKIAASAPLMGDITRRLLGAANSIGAVTFSRFFIAHVVVLPLITLLLVVAHIALVRRHGVTPQPGDERRPRKRFFPEQVWKDTLAIFVVFIALYSMAALAEVPLQELADPTDISFVPRPEWYFLFLFELLKHLPGPLEVLGTFILPGLALLALFAAPFIDRQKVVPVAQRTSAFAVAALSAAIWGGLTLNAVRTTPPPPSELAVDYSKPVPWLYINPEELASVSYYRRAGCGRCHNGGREIAHPTERDPAWLLDHIKSGGGANNLQDFQLTALANSFRKLEPNFRDSLAAAPQLAADGAAIVHRKRCIGCHKINNVGANVGPVLNGISRRRTGEWIKMRLKNPQLVSPGTKMPPMNLTPDEERQLIAYLFSLRP